MSGSAARLPQLALYGAVAAVVLVLVLRSGADHSPSAGGTAAPVSIEADARDRSPHGSKLLVHVAGAVRKPGVHELGMQARVADAIERAGGLDRRADADRINLAARLSDGQQIVVPEAAPAGAAPAVGGGSTGLEAGPVSLGSATAAELEAIDGIGPVTAAKIIEHRDSGGAVSSLTDLDAISGIGPATIESLEGRLQP